MQIRSRKVIRGFKLTWHKMYQGYPIFISFNKIASCDVSLALNMAKKKYFRHTLITSLNGTDLFHMFTDPLSIMKKDQYFV